MSDATGLRRVLERVAPAVVAENAARDLLPPVPSPRRSPSPPTRWPTPSRSLWWRRRTRPNRYAIRPPRSSGPPMKSRCGRVGTRIRSSASAPTTRSWRPGPCCVGASPRARARASLSPRPDRSPRSFHRSRSSRRWWFAGGANSTATSSSRRSRASAIAARAWSSTAPSSPFAAASSTSGRRRVTTLFVSISLATRSND